MKRPHTTLVISAFVVATSLGLLLHAPSLRSGLRTDDYVHRAMLRGEFPVPRSAIDLFAFATGEANDTRALLDFGYLPWWTVPDARLAMARPLPSLLIAFDYAAFGDAAEMHHAHSLFWFVAMLAAAALLLSRLVPLVPAVIALVAFALEEGQTVPVGWLANRSTLVATTFGCLALVAYLRYRESPTLRSACSCACLATFTVLSGEYALMILSYALAFECVAKDAWTSRLRASWPIALPALAYLGGRALLGRDVEGSGYYVSPFAAPLEFAQAALVRVPVLLADLVFGLPAGHFQGAGPLRGELLSLGLSPEVFQALPDWRYVHVALGYVAAAVVFGIFHFARRCAPLPTHRALEAVALGIVLSLLPAAGSLPSERLLIAASLGYFALVATCLWHAWSLRMSLPVDSARERPRAHPTRLTLALATLAFTTTAFIMAPLRSAATGRGFAEQADALRAWAQLAELPEAEIAKTDVYVITSADFTTAANLPFVRLAHGEPPARSYRRLSPATAPVDLQRTSERVIEVRVLTRNAALNAVPSLYRSAREPLRVGQRIELPGLAVEVLRVLDDNPIALRFTFDRSLDDPSLWFLATTAKGLRRVHMPSLGRTLRLPHPTFRDLRTAPPPSRASAQTN